MNVNIEFISSKVAANYFDKAPHTRYFQPAEIAMRGVAAGQTPTKYYQQQSARWTRSDKQILAFCVNLALPRIEKYAPGLLPRVVKFIKVRAGTEWDFPFTLDDAIVISEVMLQKFKNESEIGKHVTTIVHELVHVHQKTHGKGSVWEQIYQQYFGFRLKKITLDPQIQQYLITNPDGFLKLTSNTAEAWVIPFDLTEGTVWVYPVLVALPDDTGQFHFREMLLRLQMDHAGNLSNNGTTMIPIDAFPLYYRRFGVTKQLYHPNEIAARLISEYIVSGHVYDTVQIRAIISMLN